MNGRFQMQGSKNWIFPKEMNANRFFWDSHWLEIWSNHFCPSMGPNGGSVAMGSGGALRQLGHQLLYVLKFTILLMNFLLISQSSKPLNTKMPLITLFFGRRFKPPSFSPNRSPKNVRTV